MSYERRLEIEALPAESGWGKYVGVIGHGTELVERKFQNPQPLWVATENGPSYVLMAWLYERWRFAENSQPCERRTECYTVWEDNYRYKDYWPDAKFIDLLCATTREELCQKARVLIDADLEKLKKQVADKEATRKMF